MEEIFHITIQQSGMLTQDRVEELLTVIGRKQECINQISMIEVEVLPLEKEYLSKHSMSSWHDKFEDADEKWREIVSLRRQTISIAAETKLIEVENINKMNKEYQILKENIALLHSKRGSMQAYQGAHKQSGGFFVDNKY